METNWNKYDFHLIYFILVLFQLLKTVYAVSVFNNNTNSDHIYIVNIYQSHLNKMFHISDV